MKAEGLRAQKLFPFEPQKAPNRKLYLALPRNIRNDVRSTDYTPAAGKKQWLELRKNYTAVGCCASYLVTVSLWL